MKYFKIEPTYKKSLVEFTIFTRPLSDFREDAKENQRATLIKELGWRWGEFMVEVPETDEEVAEWLKWKEPGCESFYDLAVDYGLTELDEETGEEVLPSDKTISELIEQLLLPDLEDDYIMLTEDYPDAEMQSTWDGCWEDWSIRSNGEILEGEDVEAMIEEVVEAYSEEYEEGVEELGWSFQDCEYEMHCKPMITQVDIDGEEIGEPMQSELDE
jgi:hypothetical protein